MLRKEIRDHIVIATLSDGKTNAVTGQTLEQLKEVIRQVNTDDSIRGLILTGEGRFFSSGFSLPMFLGFNTRDEVVSFFTAEEQVLLEYFSCEKPVICAVNGHCTAMGLILAMASDYRLVADHPRIRLGMSEIKIGLKLAPAQAAVMRFGLDSDKKFRDLMYFGEMMDVTRANRLEIVDEVVDADRLMGRAREIVSLWIDTPNRPFIPIKKSLKTDTERKIKRELAEQGWQEGLCSALMNTDVKSALASVQAAMDSKSGRKPTP